MKKWPLEYQKVIKTYIPTYLWDNSDSCDSSDSSDSGNNSDSCNSSDSSDSSKSKTQFSTKLKNSNVREKE